MPEDPEDKEEDDEFDGELDEMLDYLENLSGQADVGIGRESFSGSWEHQDLQEELNEQSEPSTDEEGRPSRSRKHRRYELDQSFMWKSQRQSVNPWIPKTLMKSSHDPPEKVPEHHKQKTVLNKCK